MKNSFNLLVLTLFVFTIGFAQKPSKKNSPKALDSITKGMLQNKGLITTYSNEDNKLFFELSESVLNKELLVVTRYAQLPANYSAYRNAGSKTAEQVVRFVKKGKKNLSETSELQQYCRR